MVSGGNQATAAGEGHGAAAAVTRFALHVLRGRWFMFFASTMVMASGGGAYVFGAYSKAIKASFGYDQKTLDSLSFYKNLGASLGVLPGVISEVASPWVLLLAGAAMNLTGYLMMYLGVSGRTARPPVWLMCVYIALGATSQNFGSTGAMVTTVTNFPDDRGVVLGLLLGFAGLGGAILTQLHRCFDDGAQDGAALLRLMAWLPTAILLLSTFAVRFMARDTLAGTPAAARGERKGVLGLLRVSVLAAVYLLILNVVEMKVSRLPRLAYYVTATLLLAVLVISPLVVVVKQELETYYWVLPRSSSTTRSTPTTTSSSASASIDAAGCVVTKKQPSSTSGFQSHHDVVANKAIDIVRAACSMDMLLLLVTTMCGVGGTLTVIDNMGQIGQSLGYSQRSISMVLALVSLSNYAGRVVAGLGSDYMVAAGNLPRPLALTVTQLVACVGHLLIALGVHGGLYAASVVVGFCVGAHWTVMFAVISEVFDLAHFPVLYNLAALASPAGSYVLNVQVTGRLYDRESRRQGRKDDDDVLACVGVECFKVPLLIVTGVTLVGAAASLLLVWRTWALYRERFRRGGVTIAAAGAAAETERDGCCMI